MCNSQAPYLNENRSESVNESFGQNSGFCGDDMLLEETVFDQRCMGSEIEIS